MSQAGSEMGVKKKANRLGRGLSSLVGQGVSAGGTREPSAAATNVSRETSQDDADRIHQIPVLNIIPNPYQPRREFDEAALQELADSIKTHGLLQPITVARAEAGAGAPYQLIAGERRWRAAKMAGLKEIRAVLHDAAQENLDELALIENLQREDLGPIEEALAYQTLLDNHGYTHADLAARVSKNRSTITNSLRLLNLDPTVREMISQQLLSAGQARALAAVTNSDIQIRLAQQCVREQWSVRQAEERVKQQTSDNPQPASKPTRQANSQLDDVERQISEQLGTKVKLSQGKKKGAGKLAIEFYSLDEFDALMTRLGIHLD